MIYLQLFGVFFVIGLFTFGGGGAMLSLIQMQVVGRFGWISESQFADIVAISQCTPGPIGINCATYVGYEVGAGAGGHLAGILGSACAPFALVLPTFLIFYGIITLYNKYKGTRLFSDIMTGLRPAVAGLIFAAAIILIFKIDFGAGGLNIGILQSTFPHWTSWLILAASLAASFIWKINPILLILAGGLTGLILY